MTDPQKYVYGMRPVGKRGPIKIGSTTDIETRLASVSPNCPYPLELAFMFEGCGKMERLAQRFCADTHLHHEWFDWSENVQALIDGAHEGKSLPDILPQALPEHPDVPARRKAKKKCIESQRQAMKKYWARKKGRAA